jgi:hypothetical protein
MNKSNDTCPHQCPHGRGFKCVQCWPVSQRFRHYGRGFAVLAKFPTTPDGTKQANAYMEANPGVAALAEAEGEVILASKDDEGIPLCSQDAEVIAPDALPSFENGHWYVREDDHALFIVPDDRLGVADTHGPDDETLNKLDQAYRSMDQSKANWFDLVERTALANELGLQIVHDWQKRFDAERGYYHV